ncbi:MAG: hypothetical protein V4582_07195 [Pseudomonadota bacterium]
MLMKAWAITGGWSSNARSIDFWLAVLVWALCYHFWATDAWWDQVLSVIPNLLGFTLGGFAIFLGFGSDTFRELISDADEFKSPYISTSAAFLVFVAMQLIALLFALAAKGLYFPTPIWLKSWEDILHLGRLGSSGVGYFLFVYSIALAFRAAMRIFRLSRWYHAFIMREAAVTSNTIPKRDGDNTP